MAFVGEVRASAASIDEREQLVVRDEAADKGAFTKWTCPTCAWTEFDLVEESEVATPRRPRRPADPTRAASSRSHATLTVGAAVCR